METPSERDSRVRAFSSSPSKLKTPISQQTTATSTVDAAERAAALGELRARGVTKPDEFAHLSLEAIRGTVRWFDAQAGRVGAGVLVLVLREGGKPGWSARSRVVDEQREYGLRVAGWLNEHFPDLRQPSGWPHPGAVAAVIRLHYEFGKDGLSVVEHGPTIREAVRRFDEKWLDEEEVAA